MVEPKHSTMTMLSGESFVVEIICGLARKRGKLVEREAYVHPLVELVEKYEVEEDLMDVIVKLAEMKDWFKTYVVEYIVQELPIDKLRRFVDEAYKHYLAYMSVA